MFLSISMEETTVMDDSLIFPTFYHINDYDEDGYASLPQLIATSYPLVLWSPSGRLLESCYNDRNNPCSISPEQFVKLVEAGHIHIIARAWWFDRAIRDKYPWP